MMIQSLEYQSLIESSPDAILQLEMLKDIITYSFSGAGGGLLATYAVSVRDKKEKVNFTSQKQESLAINELREDIRNLRRDMFYLFSLIAIILTILIVAFLIK